VYAQHGRELMGFESPVCEPLFAMSVEEILAEGNCDIARCRGKEAGGQDCEPTDRNSIQGRRAG
jgi:hypothetical protein